jgi:energy-coupling factor transporter transmembrane protein EcfT
MTHEWHDTYRHASTPAHHLDPRSKLFVGILFVSAVLFTREWGILQKVGYPALLVIILFLTRLPIMTVVKRTLSIWQFALLMLLVSMTTPFPDLLRALEQCRTPRILVLFLAFLYRYAAVLGKETVRVERGWRSRTFGRFWWREWSKLGHVLAALLIRSYERAERVYAAMLARGFSSRMPAMRLLHFGLSDAAFVSLSCAILFFVRWGRV